MPKISIVLPVYNGEKFLRESIDSVINQSFQDWELIVVDDCSTDSTPQIIDEYAKMDKRLKYIRNSVNKKLPMSLNVGFRQAKGMYYTWTSDDNLYLPNALAIMNNYLDNNSDSPMVVANMELFGNDDVNGLIQRYNEEEIYLNNCVGACFLYRKDVADKVGEYDSNMFLVEDYDYWLRILFTQGKIGHIDENLYKYRYHEKSLSSTRKIQIQKQLNLLRINKINYLIPELESNNNLFCRLFYELCLDDDVPKPLLSEMKRKLPELKNDCFFDDAKKYVIFGAGNIGNDMYEMLKDKAVAYVDNNEKIVGSFKNNLKINDVTELKGNLSGYHVMVAVSIERIYDILVQLRSMGINEYCSWVIYETNRIRTI